MKYSFIVPVYNCEKFIDACVSSILAQGISDFEIILVDDGSKDSSGDICDRYANENECVKVFHKENSGVSGTRNFGLEKAQGDYICFVDSDDTISPYLLRYAEGFECDYDIIVFRHTRQGENALCNELTNAELTPADKQTVLDRTLYDAENSGEYLFNTVSKLYKKEIIKNIRFAPDIPIGEDKIFGFHAFINAEKIFFCDRVMYYCRPNSGSIMHSYCKNYSGVSDRAYEEYEKIIPQDDNAEHYSKMLSLKAVKAMHTIATLELCNKACEMSYAERKSKWNRIMKNSTTGRYFAQCSGDGLNKTDLFYLSAYKHSFFRVNLMTKYKLFKAIEYGLYKIFGR